MYADGASDTPHDERGHGHPMQLARTIRRPQEPVERRAPDPGRHLESLGNHRIQVVRVSPASLRAAFRTAKWLTDDQGVVLMQGALARFIDEGLLTRHVRKASKEYAARHAPWSLI